MHDMYKEVPNAKDGWFHDLKIIYFHISGDRRRSMFVEEPTYVPHPMLYEPLYGGVIPPGYMPLPPPRTRMSLTHPPEYVMAGLGYTNPNSRRHSR